MGIQISNADDRQTLFARLDVLRFPLILLVIYIHSAGVLIHGIDPAMRVGSDGPLFHFLMYFLSDGIARIATPIFYFMSGFLFFYLARWGYATYVAKLKSRFRSLFIPYVFWNLLWFALLLISPANRAAEPLFTGALTDLPPGYFFDLANRVFGFTQFPLVYQFWFIRDLMILVVLSPLFYIAARYLGWVGFIVLAALWFFDQWPLSAPEIEPILFFYVGAYLSIKERSPFAWDRCTLPLACTALVAFGLDAVIEPKMFSRVLRCVGVFSGIVAALGCTRFALTYRLGFLSKLSAASFFVFATHEPILTVLTKFIYGHVQMTQGLAIVLYLGLPLLIAAAAVFGYYVLKAVTPKFLAVISGGR